MDSRIDWPELRTTCVEHLVDQLEGLHCNQPANRDEMYNLIEELDESDFVRVEFYYFLPYLLDMIEKEPKKYREPISNICHKLTKDVDSSKSTADVQLENQRSRLLKVILTCLEICRAEGGRTFEFHLLISGVCAIYGDPDFGIEIQRLYDDS